MKNLIVAMSVAVLTCGPLYAEEKKSAVQMAAAAKLAGSLGTLRGAIKPDDKHIYLTTKILEQWLPVKVDQTFTGSIPALPAASVPMTNKPKLPPIVWEIIPGTGQANDNVMTGSTINGPSRQPEKPSASPPPSELTVARAILPYSIEGLFGIPDANISK